MFTLGNQPSFAEAPKRDQRVRCAQPWIIATERNLQCLRDEFDLTDSTAAKFDVESFLDALALNVDFIFRGANVRQSIADTDVRSVNPRLSKFDETREKFLRARCGSRANQRLQLPILRRLPVIINRLGERTRQRSFATMRPQTHVDAIRGAFAGRFTDKSQQTFSKLDEVLAIRDLAMRAPACRLSVIGEQKHQIDV